MDKVMVPIIPVSIIGTMEIYPKKVKIQAEKWKINMKTWKITVSEIGKNGLPGCRRTCIAEETEKIGIRTTSVKKQYGELQD